MKKIWEILGIQKTKDATKIKDAYYEKLSKVNPEDNQEGFMRLRKAYEEAIEYTKSEEEEKGEIELWIDKVEEIYNDFNKRMDIENWKELFRDDVCQGLDSRLEAKEKFIVFLMNNCTLPKEVWKEIDKEFEILENQDKLLSKFPENFVNYMVNCIQIGIFFDLSLVVWHGEENVDDYMDKYYSLKEAVDNNDIEGAIRATEILEEFSTYHPFKDVEKLRLLIIQGKMEEAKNILEELKKCKYKNTYIRFNIAKATFDFGKYEEALKYAEEIIDEYPEHYMANMLKGQCLGALGDFKKAKDVIFDLMYKTNYSESLQDIIVEINNHMMEKLDKNSPEDLLEYAWCLYQNNRSKEAEEMIEKIDINAVDEYYYINLISRVKLINEKYEEAYEYLNKWIDMILSTNENEECYYKRHRLLDYAYSSLGGCCMELKREDEAEKYMLLASEEADRKNGSLRFEMKERLAWYYYQKEDYERSIEYCNQIIEEDPNYFTAYLRRQDAEFKLGYDSEVVRDYYESIRIYDKFIRPYNHAIEVFLNHGQYEDAKGIIDKAKELELDSNRFTLLLLRYDKETNEKFNVDEGIKICLELKNKLDDEDNDIEDKGELLFELALLYERKLSYIEAIDVIEEAIKFKPRDYYYHFKGFLYGKTKTVKDRIKVYKEGLKHNPNSVRLLYEIGKALYDIDEDKKALEYLLKLEKLAPDYKDSYELISKLYDSLYYETEEVKYKGMSIEYANKDLETCDERALPYYLKNRGLIYERFYLLEEAIEDYKKAVECDPKDWVAYNNIGYVYTIMRKTDLAIQNLEESIKRVSLEEKSKPYVNLTIAYMLKGDYQKAIEYSLMVIDKYPDKYETIRNLSEIYMFIGDYDKSVEAIKKLESFRDKDLLLPYFRFLFYSYIHQKNGGKVDQKLVAKYEKLAAKGSKDDIENIITYIFYKVVTDFSPKKIMLLVKSLEKEIQKENDNDNIITFIFLIIQIKWKLKGVVLDKKIQGYIDYIDEIQVYYGKKALEIIKRDNGSIEHYLEYKSHLARRAYEVAFAYLGMKDYKNARKYQKMGQTCFQCPKCIYKKCHEAYLLLIAIEIETENYEEADRVLKELMEITPIDRDAIFAQEVLECFLER